MAIFLQLPGPEERLSDTVKFTAERTLTSASVVPQHEEEQSKRMESTFRILIIYE